MPTARSLYAQFSSEEFDAMDALGNFYTSAELHDQYRREDLHYYSVITTNTSWRTLTRIEPYEDGNLIWRETRIDKFHLSIDRTLENIARFEQSIEELLPLLTAKSGNNIIRCFKICHKQEMLTGKFGSNAVGKEVTIYPQAGSHLYLAEKNNEAYELYRDNPEQQTIYWQNLLSNIEAVLEKYNVVPGHPGRGNKPVPGSKYTYSRDAFNIFNVYITADVLCEAGFRREEACYLGREPRYWTDLSLTTVALPAILSQPNLYIDAEPIVLAKNFASDQSMILKEAYCNNIREYLIRTIGERPKDVMPWYTICHDCHDAANREFTPTGGIVGLLDEYLDLAANITSVILQNVTVMNDKEPNACIVPFLYHHLIVPCSQRADESYKTKNGSAATWNARYVNSYELTQLLRNEINIFLQDLEQSKKLIEGIVQCSLRDPSYLEQNLGGYSDADIAKLVSDSVSNFLNYEQQIAELTALNKFNSVTLTKDSVKVPGVQRW